MRLPLLAMWFLFFVGSPALAQPITIQPGEPHQALFGDEDGGLVLSCTPELLPFIQGVERVEEGGVSHCVYQFIRHLRVGSEMLSLVMVRYASEHEEHSFLHESVALLDAQGRAFATVTQLDIEQHEELSRIRMRRFRRVSLPDESGNPRPGICIETVEERGAGSFTVWSLERRGRPWIPRVQHRAVDAWLFDFDRAQAVRLIRRSALDGLCPARGYARFVEGDSEDLGAVEARRVVGEVALPDDAPEARPAYVVPWRRGQRIRLRDVRRAFPGHRRYWLDSVGYENSPDTREPILCVGDDACRVRIGLINPDATDEPGRRMGWMLYGDTPRFAGEILVRDGSVEGPDGIRVGASYSALASSLEECVASYGDFIGMTCRSIREPTVFVQLQGDGFSHCDSNSDTPCSEALATAQVVEFNLARR